MGLNQFNFTYLFPFLTKLLRYFCLLLLSLGFSFQCKGSEKQFDYQRTQSVGQISPEEPWRFSPEFALDNKPTTAFCSNAKEVGSGFTLYLKSYSEFSALQIFNGFHKSALDLKSNDAVKKLRITSFDMETEDLKSKLKIGSTVDLELTKPKFGKSGFQILDLDSKFQGNVIRFEILETHGLGSTGRVCISEISFGEIQKDNFVSYPWVSFDKIKNTIIQFGKAERHFSGFKQLVLANEKGTISFYDQGTILPVFLSLTKPLVFRRCMEKEIL